jgi:hypothetical protein
VPVQEVIRRVLNTMSRARALVAVTACALSTTVVMATTDALARTGTPAATAPARAAAHGPDLTSHAYFVDVLRRMKLPITQTNLDALYAVEHREGDNDRYNPLNVVQPEPGSHAYNSIGVQRYANFRTGVAGTAHLLANGHWTGVRAALRKGNSTSRVLAAFSAAYTWSGGIKFQTDPATLEAEAVRDVGGKYAQPGPAARRAAQQQSGLRAVIKRLRSAMASATSTSDAAHRDWAAQRTRNTVASAVAAAQGPTAAALGLRAARERQVFLSAITSQYMSGGSAASVAQLLNSTSATDYLSYMTLQRYVTDDERTVLKRYAVEQKQASAVAGVVAGARATMRATSAAMTREHSVWTKADARTAELRGRLAAALRAALQNSITQPLAAAQLAQLYPAKRAPAKSKHTHHSKHPKRVNQG